MGSMPEKLTRGAQTDHFPFFEFWGGGGRGAGGGGEYENRNKTHKNASKAHQNHRIIAWKMTAHRFPSRFHRFLSDVVRLLRDLGMF